MGRKRVTLIVYADLDSNASPETARQGLSRLLNRTIPHFNPVVSLGPEDQPENTNTEGTIEE